jgi:16S rRNA (uracil1498-N3)-methyltransferase
MAGWAAYDAMITDADNSLPVAYRTAAHVIVADLESLDLADDERHHLQAVLRLRPGEMVSATDGRGGWRPCRYQPDATLMADGAVVRASRPAPLLTVGFPPVKGDRPEWAVQKLTEFGVDRIVLLSSERAVVRWDGARADHHLARLRSVVRQAVRQSRQIWVPELTGLEGAASLASRPGVAMASWTGAPPSLAFPTVLVGPEGGWSPQEQAQASALVRLGSGVLRTESAAVAAGLLLAALRGGLVLPAGPP